MSKIYIQGYEGSFHQMAALKFFGKNIEVAPCATFNELIKKTSSLENDVKGVMAIENSIAGSILPNYNLLQKSDLTIIGEIYLQIDQNLLVNKEVELEDIREVQSHPMALQQCFDYLEKHSWKLLETEDTALSAKHIHQHKSKHIAAIASKLAAELFDLKIIASNIHTMKNNYTRFLMLQHNNQAQAVEKANKASVNFHTDHSKGSLAKVLTKIAEADINLSKLQSFPIPGSNFKYSFHADLEFKNLSQFEKLIEKMKPITAYLKIYGIYKNGNLK
ncbi:MAG: prephenate dehydratase [Parafilimonas sp.]